MLRRLLLLSLILCLPGCLSCAPVVHVPETQGIPVSVGKVDLPDLPGGDEPEEPAMVITVPPSDKPTVIPVWKEKLTVKQRVLSNKPAYKVESNNAAVTVVQPKKTLWWRYAAVYVGGAILALLVAGAVAYRVVNINPLSWLKK